VLGNIGAWPVVIMAGRFHLYEGYRYRPSSFLCASLPVWVSAPRFSPTPPRINLAYGQGRLVVIKDHINLQGQESLVGPEDPRFGLRFIDMSEAIARATGRWRTTRGND